MTIPKCQQGLLRVKNSLFNLNSKGLPRGLSGAVTNICDLICDGPPKGVTGIREPLKEHKENRGGCNHQSGRVTLILWSLVQCSPSFTVFYLYPVPPLLAALSYSVLIFLIFLLSPAPFFPFPPSVGFPN